MTAYFEANPVAPAWSASASMGADGVITVAVDSAGQSIKVSVKWSMLLIRTKYILWELLELGQQEIIDLSLLVREIQASTLSVLRPERTSIDVR